MICTRAWESIPFSDSWKFFPLGYCPSSCLADSYFVQFDSATAIDGISNSCNDILDRNETSHPVAFLCSRRPYSKSCLLTHCQEIATAPNQLACGQINQYNSKISPALSSPYIRDIPTPDLVRPIHIKLPVQLVRYSYMLLRRAVVTMLRLLAAHKIQLFHQSPCTITTQGGSHISNQSCNCSRSGRTVTEFVRSTNKCF